MEKFYKNLIIIISVIIVIFFSTVMFFLYNNNLKPDEVLETEMIDTESIIISTTSEIILESNEDNSDKNPYTEKYEAKTNEEKYKSSEHFKSVEKRDKKDLFYFMGDVYLSKHPRSAYDEMGVKGIIDDSYQKLINSGDFIVANLECSITDKTSDAADKTFTFALPTKYVKAFKEIGINLFTMANNHILDYGVDSMLNSMKLLDDNGIQHIGVGRSIDEARTAYIKEIEGKRYAFIGASSVLPAESWKATYDNAGVFNGYNIADLCEEIKAVKPYVDKVIVYMHWGRELEETSNDWQKQYARRIVNAGADLVVGAHSHTVQEIEYYNGVPIIYSLGNFIYGGTMRDTILLEASFDYSNDKNGQLQLRIYTGVSNYQKVRKDWNKEEIAVKIKNLQDRSSTCYIGDNGYIFTMAQVEAALKQLETAGSAN